MTYDFRPAADTHNIWTVFHDHPHREKIVPTLLASKGVKDGLAAFRADKTKLPALVDAVARRTENLIGDLVCEMFGKKVPFDTEDTTHSGWRALQPGTESAVAEAIVHDKELAALLHSITDAYLVNRISRMTGMAMSQEAVAEVTDLVTFVSKIVKLA